MSEHRWQVDEQGRFAVRLPPEWVAEPDAEEGGIDVWHADGAGELHLVGFPPAGDEAPDPGEELYAFLQENDIELQEDEIEDVELDEGGALALCHYLSEDEDGEEWFWLVGVATLPSGAVFAHYACAAGEEDEAEVDTVHAILRSLRSTPVG
jgi:hypothetical protein